MKENQESVHLHRRQAFQHDWVLGCEAQVSFVKTKDVVEGVRVLKHILEVIGILLEKPSRDVIQPTFHLRKRSEGTWVSIDQFTHREDEQLITASVKLALAESRDVGLGFRVLPVLIRRAKRIGS